MEGDIEYIKLFMEYESDDMPMVYFYEVDLKDDRFALRAIEVFVNRTVKIYHDLYDDAIEACPIPTVDEFNLLRKSPLLSRKDESGGLGDLLVSGGVQAPPDKLR